MFHNLISQSLRVVDGVSKATTFNWRCYVERSPPPRRRRCVSGLFDLSATSLLPSLLFAQNAHWNAFEPATSIACFVREREGLWASVDSMVSGSGSPIHNAMRAQSVGRSVGPLTGARDGAKGAREARSRRPGLASRNLGTEAGAGGRGEV